ncbi:maltooligosyl trehalose synthase [Brevibacterium sanguinis]|uniref:Maltooligosyl trehalose synthase n=2 Tax=Brevibacterium TaxID=1696 RepID=A0A366ILQ2_9MICO|nr:MULTISPECIES: malto-oligosyltrehalose synthase [Brevibacterium]RBP67131.1 maltooligosyl trehalose synthase [Brevibacterium sanguinis]RBP73656.1 maltooligosyl trehalose synthase [Brevibacterium celere]
MRTPQSTYRIQVRPSFDLHEVSRQVDYLRALGADWVYLSPLLAAEPGSDHGYDVIDHSRIDPGRGGADGLAAAAGAAHDAGLGVLIDIVPNHVGTATPAVSLWWWDLLLHGTDSRYAQAFDVDWEFGGGRVRIPVLGDDAGPRAGSELEKLTVEPLDDGTPVLRYVDHRFPIAAGTLPDDGTEIDPLAVHARQNYELINWRRADDELNYRRFFGVSTLAGIRVEVPWVFDESHEEIVRWFAAGLADGLRVDHPDGLRDPRGYLDRLGEVTGGAYVLVEKILEPGETLPAGWATAGTTGYDALADIDRVLVDDAGRQGLDELDAALCGGTRDPWTELIHGTKRTIADGLLRSEVLRLARLAPDVEDAADALAEVIANFPVYRSYLPDGAHHLAEAVEESLRRRPDLGDPLRALVPRLSDPDDPLALRFQQTSGMVMAKGVEDTAFYRYTRLTSLTEVGGDPSEFSITPAEFHRRQLDREQRTPAAMTTLSTHDTKRGEDVRARIDVLSELPGDWADLLGELSRRAPLPDGPLANLLWQAVVGAWPISRDRLHAYAEKAAREAGNSTTWTAPDGEFEDALHALVDSCFDDREVAGLLTGFVGRIAQFGWSNSLSAKLIQLTAPGVPDVYQGSELWETSLVDPDNRRAVDFAARRALLAEIDSGRRPPVDETGAAKLLVVSRALQLRRDRPELFSGYRALSAEGPARAHFLGFDRGGALTLTTRLPARLAGRATGTGTAGGDAGTGTAGGDAGTGTAGAWSTTEVALPSGSFVDVLTGRTHSGRARLAEVFAQYPVALLAPAGP